MEGIPINFRGILAVSIAVTLLMIAFMKLNSKDKAEYETTTGPVTYLDKQLGQLPARNLGKYRYLEVQGYKYPFEIFIGNDPGDFKPKYERMDELKPGDTITVYYYQTSDTEREEVNRFLQFIDKQNESYFERGDSSKVIGLVVISLSALLLAAGVILLKLNKISF